LTVLPLQPHCICDMSTGDDDEEVVRIACVGSSITKGIGLADPESESYPAQLATFLAAHGYPAADVRNFGEGGAGVLKRGSSPYEETDQFGDALAFDPDVVIILLGTNDSNEKFWGNEAVSAALVKAKEDICGSFAQEEALLAIVHGEQEFEPALEELVEIFSRMPAQPEIFLCTPAPLFDTTGWLKQEVLQKEIAPRIRSVATRRRLHLVELQDSPLQQQPECFPDGLHPNVAGATEIAAIVGQALLQAKDRQGDAQAQGQIEELGAASELDEAAVSQQKLEEERQIVLEQLHGMRKQQAF